MKSVGNTIRGQVRARIWKHVKGRVRVRGSVWVSIRRLGL